jgi:hypothetical protein
VVYYSLFILSRQLASAFNFLLKIIIIITIIIIIIKCYWAAVSSVMYLVHYLSLHAYISNTTALPVNKLLGKIFWILCYKNYQTTNWLETWHCMHQERISLDEILLETTVMIDFKCPSVKQVWLFILLLFIRENIVHTHKCCQTLQSFLRQRL